MNSSKSTEYKVGAFLLFTAFLFILTLFILGGDKALFSSYAHYTIQLKQVQGIAKGSVVQLLGINIGNVDSVTINPDEQLVTVTVKVDKKYKDLFTKGTTAGVRTQGALGDKFIFITPGPSNAQVLTEAAMIESEPDSDLMSILSQKGGDFNRVFDILKDLQIFAKSLTNENRSAILMQNLTESSGYLKSTLNDLHHLTASLSGTEKDNKLKASLVHLDSILSKIDNGNGTLGKLINDPSLYQDVERIFGGNSRSKYLKGIIRDSIQKSEK